MNVREKWKHRKIKLTFPVDPQERALPRRLPLGEPFVVYEPGTGFHMSRFEGDVVIFIRIRGGEPVSYIDQ